MERNGEREKEGEECVREKKRERERFFFVCVSEREKKDDRVCVNV
jgi:hypothetical protein